MTALFENYRRAPVTLERGQGSTLFDHQGKAYLDFLSGIAVSSLGHCHPRMVAALQEQVAKVLHVSNLYTIPVQEQAARKLTELCGYQKAFFCNSGAEANEALLKMARRYAHQHGLPPVVVVAENSFHGRTLGTLSATGNPKYQENFHPLLEGFRFVPFHDTRATLDALEGACAVLLEPVQGEGGVIPAHPDHLRAVESACRSTGKLFLLDEVQTGIGRTGRWLAAEHYGVRADAVALAKGLGGGVPVGAVLASAELAALLPPGSHGTTYGGNPLAATAVLTVLEVIEEEGLLQQVERNGALLRELLLDVAGVTEVRGLGLLIAAELDRDAAEVSQACLEAGLLVNAVRPTSLRFAPPLVVQPEEITRAVNCLEDVLCRTKTSDSAASAR